MNFEEKIYYAIPQMVNGIVLDNKARMKIANRVISALSSNSEETMFNKEETGEWEKLKKTKLYQQIMK